MPNILNPLTEAQLAYDPKEIIAFEAESHWRKEAKELFSPAQRNEWSAIYKHFKWVNGPPSTELGVTYRTIQ